MPRAYWIFLFVELIVYAFLGLKDVFLHRGNALEAVGWNFFFGWIPLTFIISSMFTIFAAHRFLRDKKALDKILISICFVIGTTVFSLVLYVIISQLIDWFKIGYGW